MCRSPLCLLFSSHHIVGCILKFRTIPLVFISLMTLTMTTAGSFHLVLADPDANIFRDTHHIISEKIALIGQRFPLTGTIDQAGNDIQRIKQMEIDHIIFGSIGKDLDKVMDITKQLSKFAR